MFNPLNLFRRIGEKKRARLVAEKAIAARIAEREKVAQEENRYLEFMQHLEEIARIVQERKQEQNDIY